MTTWQTQLEAIGSALLLIQSLPDDTVWSLTCTNDDDVSSPSVLNIFAYSTEWPALRDRLKLGRPIDQSTREDHDQFMSFKQGTLLISLIEEENND